MEDSKTTILSIRFIYILAFLFISWTVIKSEGAKATEHVYVDHVTCSFPSKFTSNCSCRLKFVTRMIKSYTVICTAVKPLDVLMTHIQLFYKYRSGYQSFLINVRPNLCDYFGNKAGTNEKVTALVMPKIKQYLTTSQNLTCPYVGQFDLVGLPLDGNFLHNMFYPVGDYMFNITLTNGKVVVWNGRFFFTIPAGKTIEDDRMGR